MPQNFKNFIAVLSLLLLLPPLTFAQNANERVTALAQDDCRKIAGRLGESIPEVSTPSNNSIAYGNCNFQDLRGNTSKLVEDVKIFIYSIALNRYASAENASDDLRNEMKAASDNLAKTDSSEMRSESIAETPDGYFHILKFQNDLAGNVVGDNNIVLNDFIVNTVKGNCRIIVRGSSYLENNKKASYHFYGPGNEAVDTHPNFNHNREEEILTLTRGKSEELLNLLNCENGVSSPKSNSLNKSNYTRALVVEPPKMSDFQIISRLDFKIVSPVGTDSATPKPAAERVNSTGTTFIGKTGGEGKILIDPPDGETVTLTNDRTAYDGKLSGWRWIRGVDQILKKPNLQISIYEQDCQIEVRQANENRWASDWSTSIKRSDNCTYRIEEDPIRILANSGKTIIETPSGSAATGEKADFGAYFDAASEQSVFEIYNGVITITNKEGNSKTIFTAYGSEIKQIEVDKNGVMSEKIAIPQSRWQSFMATGQEKKEEAMGNALPIAGAVIVIVLGGIAFFLYRTGKIQLFYQLSRQKITGIFHRISKERKTD